jgi:ferric-dicitrate binding protein FerR (iron transport regulator)
MSADPAVLAVETLYANHHGWQRIESSLDTLRAQPSRLAHAVLTASSAVSRRQITKALGLALFVGSTAWLVDEKTGWRHWMAAVAPANARTSRCPTAHAYN